MFWLNLREGQFRMNCMKTAMSKSQIFTFTYALNLLNCRLDPYFGCRALAAEGPYFKKRIGSLFLILEVPMDLEHSVS